jgi:hypothetical protein
VVKLEGVEEGGFSEGIEGFRLLGGGRGWWEC